MSGQNFLHKLKEEEKLELVESSEEIKESYLEKSASSLKAANLLQKSGLYAEGTSMAYYGIYHCLLALLFKCGIKCENHTGGILLLDVLFAEKDLSEQVLKIKKERIDKQYYIDFVATKESTEAIIKTAQGVVIKIKLLIESLNEIKIKETRARFEQV